MLTRKDVLRMVPSLFTNTSLACWKNFSNCRYAAIRACQALALANNANALDRDIHFADHCHLLHLHCKELEIPSNLQSHKSSRSIGGRSPRIWQQAKGVSVNESFYMHQK